METGRCCCALGEKRLPHRYDIPYRLAPRIVVRQGTILLALARVDLWRYQGSTLDRQGKAQMFFAGDQIDVNVTEAANEAKDNVKFLSTLERFIEPLYSGTATTIIDTLPALMNSIKMIHTIAR